MFAPIRAADIRELQALDEFIRLKERQIARHTQVERNMAAITETEWLKNYLAEFPQRNHVATTNDPFWPDEYIMNTTSVQQLEEPGTTSNFAEEQETHDILANLPQVQSRTYFGPTNLKARWIAIGAASTSRNLCPRPRTGEHRRTVATRDIDLATRTSGDPFPAFDQHKDIGIGSFVAMCSPESERRNGATFYVGKVRALNCVADAEGMMHVIWYWPKMLCGSTDAPGEWHQ